MGCIVLFIASFFGFAYLGKLGKVEKPTYVVFAFCALAVTMFIGLFWMKAVVYATAVFIIVPFIIHLFGECCACSFKTKLEKEEEQD